MSKELEALERIKCIVNYDGGINLKALGNSYKKEFELIETALNELEEYKSILKDFGLENPHNLIDNLNIINDGNFHKKLKALEIINNKNVDTLRIKITPNVTRYNKKRIWGCKNLTKEEYDLLKEALL